MPWDFLAASVLRGLIPVACSGLCRALATSSLSESLSAHMGAVRYVLPMTLESNHTEWVVRRPCSAVPAVRSLVSSSRTSELPPSERPSGNLAALLLDYTPCRNGVLAVQPSGVFRTPNGLLGTPSGVCCATDATAASPASAPTAPQEGYLPGAPLRYRCC